MPEASLSDRYRGYISCLNARDWPGLGRFVHEAVWSVIDKAAVASQIWENGIAFGSGQAT